jgi:ATP-dependent DNA helicase RecG
VPRRPRPPADAPAFASAGEAPLSSLPGVGPALAEKFAARGLLQVQDLWLHLPARYEDRTRLTRIADLQPGVPALVEARVEAVERGFKWRPMLRVIAGRAAAAHARAALFPFQRRAGGAIPSRPAPARLRRGAPGRPRLEMVHPELPLPVRRGRRRAARGARPGVSGDRGHRRADGGALVGEALKRLPPDEELELLPPSCCAALGLPSLREALLARTGRRDA